ncbi:MULTISPECIES: hypothetical protein [Thiomicrorhabdus]|uniref:Uncharacterized protein n=1 Tax=Thiomicrorhabdus heinhorstiae TaxID=2748010 RepID=A0ABS0BWU3_9GAMM|nr:MULTISPECIES: hypothetical protein [Thiomicrorhabdus]MBF6057864.1 hypothetical protein [Thiomicrorhabdus heinhorstiae]
MFDSVVELSDSSFILLALGEGAKPTFKAVHTDRNFLAALGDEMVYPEKSQFVRFQVIPAKDIFSLNYPGTHFDHVLEAIIKNILLGQNVEQVVRI